MKKNINKCESAVFAEKDFHKGIFCEARQFNHAAALAQFHATAIQVPEDGLCPFRHVKCRPGNRSRRVVVEKMNCITRGSLFHLHKDALRQGPNRDLRRKADISKIGHKATATVLR